mgnify:CR=1 FL=1
MKKEKENLRESKLTCNINLYKNKKRGDVRRVHFKRRGGILYDMSEVRQ